MPAQIYIVEDHAIMRQVLKEAIEKIPGLAVCGMATSGEEALAALVEIEADLALVDMSLPQMSGAELIGELHKQRPALYCLILSGHKESSYVEQALTAGARGYVLKGDPREIGEAIAQVLAGKIYLSKALKQPDSLSDNL
jgi:DNA-binding NarL/FixJ family response regulator